MRYSKYEIAKRLGLSHQAVYLWYKGKTKPSLENLIKLSQLLNITLEKAIEQFNSMGKGPKV